MTKVLVVDDSFFVRRRLADVISGFSGFNVHDSTQNGKEALKVLNNTGEIDVVTLDVEMPKMDGIETLRSMRREGFDQPVLMVSASTEKQAKVTTKALKNGAADVIRKPSASSGTDMEEIESALEKKLRAVTDPSDQPNNSNNYESGSAGRSDGTRDRERNLREKLSELETRAVVIGGSTGSPETISQIVRNLPDNFQLPVIIVQHIKNPFLSTFGERLKQESNHSVTMVDSREELKPETIYLPKSEDHIVVEKDLNRFYVSLRDGKPVHNSQPSVSVLFDSAKKTFGSEVIAILLSGMGKDGADSMKELHDQGALCLIENRASSTVFEMPGEVEALGAYDREAPSEEIPRTLAEWSKKTSVQS